ncbi:MAG: hypothetical protein ACQES9_10950 [Myxococcota bacterium]
MKLNILLVSVAMFFVPLIFTNCKKNKGRQSDKAPTKYKLPQWKITIVPKMKKGKNITLRENSNDGVIPIPFVNAQQFLKNLKRAYKSAHHFVVLDNYKRKQRNHFTNHEIRELDLKNLINFTLEELQKEEVQFFRTTDQMTYPRCIAVWQKNGFFKALRISLNNDNDAITFIVKKGKFKNSRYFDQRTKKLTRTEFIKKIGFIKEKKTIYPHLEKYYVCPPDCSSKSKGNS